jgi:hypothetical protein
MLDAASSAETPGMSVESHPCPKNPELFDTAGGGDETPESNPRGIPFYELTDCQFQSLRGKIDGERLDALKSRFGNILRLGRQMQLHPKHVECTDKPSFLREVCASSIARLSMTPADVGLDPRGLQCLRDIEKDAGINKRVHRRAAWHAKEALKGHMYDDRDDDDSAGCAPGS